MPAEMPKSFLGPILLSGRAGEENRFFIGKKMVEFVRNRIKLLLFLVFWVLAIFFNSTYLYAKQKQQTIQPGPDKGMDTYISKGCGDEHKNFGDKEDMVIGNRDNKRILLRFDLASIPPDAIISSAELQVCLATQYNFTQKVIYVHRIKSFWKDKEVTWYENKQKHNWTMPGGDFDWAIESAVSLNGYRYGWVSWDVTRAVKDWFDDKDINVGFLLKQDSNDSGEIWFLASNLEWEAYRPRLVVSYEAEEVPRREEREARMAYLIASLYEEGMAYLNQKQYIEAIAKFSEILLLDPEDKTAISKMKEANRLLMETQ